jgi:hypothetical protein
MSVIPALGRLRQENQRAPSTGEREREREGGNEEELREGSEIDRKEVGRVKANWMHIE